MRKPRRPLAVGAGTAVTRCLQSAGKENLRFLSTVTPNWPLDILLRLAR